MLEQRILTALALAALLIPALFFLPRAGFAVLVGVVVFATAFEWAALVRLAGGSRLVFALLLTLAGTLLLMLDGALGWVFGAAVLLWLALAVRLALGERAPTFVHGRTYKLILAPLVLWPAWLAMDALRNLPDGPLWVLATFMVVWVADSAAYFSGRCFGRHKLAPAISPGKTVEGVVGALVAVLLVGWVAHTVDPYANLPLLSWLLLLFAVTLISVIGDLHESQLKREAGVKDSGSLLPGHGGMFDRVDSLLAAAPLMAFGLLKLGVLHG
ncbi:MAG: phosphatidate cytidylyltransferase [Halothiobacillaceae bacterium]